jgi:dihydrofolate synthase/folylpolyglutamate synthase
MNYKETIQYLFSSTPVFEHVGASAYKAGLENTISLDNHFNHPHKKFKTIHVAGTNGKGSCSHTIAAVLQSLGYKVGLYTSPHLVDFRERIKVNGECVSEKYVIDFVEQEKSFFEPLHPSFFEITTAMAFKYFTDMNIDVAVVEVGLGGRLDCTNIITPVISVITNISFDHTQFLGDTLAKIAGEKAGIIKSGVPVVIGEYVEETRPVFIEKAKEMNAPIIFAQDEPEVTSFEFIPSGGMSLHTRHFGDLRYELGGLYQSKNANTILKAISILTKDLRADLKAEAENRIEIKDIAKGFDNVCELTGLEGRWQILQKRPLIVCDTGHNVGGWQYLAPQIKAQKCHKRLIVFGMVDDKDINTVMELLPKDAIYFFTQANIKRAIPVEKVVQCANKHGLKGCAYDSVSKAYDAARDSAEPDDFIFIGGSSYIVSDLLTSI